MIQIKHTKLNLMDWYFYMKHYNLAPDWWMELTDLAGASHEQREIFKIVRGGERVGYAWAEVAYDECAGKRVTVGICFDKAHRGRLVRGDIQQFFKLFGYSFKKWGVDRIVVKFPDNRLAVERFFKVLGFKYEGRALDAMRIRNRPVNIVTLGMTKRYYGLRTRGETHALSIVGNPGGSKGGRCNILAIQEGQPGSNPARAARSVEVRPGYQQPAHGNHGPASEPARESSGGGDDLAEGNIGGEEIRSPAQA